jgi:hypothetical protein
MEKLNLFADRKKHGDTSNRCGNLLNHLYKAFTTLYNKKADGQTPELVPTNILQNLFIIVYYRAWGQMVC